jgi:transcriptional regulator with GAF, ATPase, and Fis domain
VAARDDPCADLSARVPSRGRGRGRSGRCDASRVLCRSHPDSDRGPAVDWHVDPATKRGYTISNTLLAEPDTRARRRRPTLPRSEGGAADHERGAFTDAIAQKIGRFELANGGTLFLDEVGELPLELQPKLLRVLQEWEFERLGGTRTIKVDVRLVAATNRDLAQMVRERRFRDDLYYRLNVFPIHVPPLRERPEDIEALVRHFVVRLAARMNRRIELIPPKTIEAMRRYSWPGNVRELENLIERAIILSPGQTLDVPLGDVERRPSDGGVDDGTASLDRMTRMHIVRVLNEANWMVGGRHGAAVRLGMHRTTLQSLMKRLGLSRPPDGAFPAPRHPSPSA